jgi:hypothetical protein
MRRSTERPQTYDCNSSVKFDPELDNPKEVIRKVKLITGTKWEHRLGDGKSSGRLVSDLEQRLTKNLLSTHNSFDYHIPIDRSYQGDGL